MFADMVRMTSSTGGASTLTLASAVGFASFADVFGTTATMFVAYVIEEFTDSTLVTLSKAETGIGTLVLSTLVLTRTKILTTWDGGVFDWTAPAAVSFGSTSANIRISCSPTAGHSHLTVPWVQTSLGDAVGLPSGNGVQVLTQALSANQETYVPFLWLGGPEVIQGSAWVTTAVNSTHIKVALYEVTTTGLPGRKVFDVAAGTPFDSSTTGAKSATVSAYLPVGWYYAAFLSDGAPTLRAWGYVRPHPGGNGTSENTQYEFTGSGSYATGLPATVTASLTGSSGPNSPMLWLKAR